MTTTTKATAKTDKRPPLDIIAAATEHQAQMQRRRGAAKRALRELRDDVPKAQRRDDEAAATEVADGKEPGKQAHAAKLQAAIVDAELKLRAFEQACRDAKRELAEAVEVHGQAARELLNAAEVAAAGEAAESLEGFLSASQRIVELRREAQGLQRERRRRDKRLPMYTPNVSIPLGGGVQFEPSRLIEFLKQWLRPEVDEA